MTPALQRMGRTAAELAARGNRTGAYLQLQTLRRAQARALASGARSPQQARLAALTGDA